MVIIRLRNTGKKEIRPFKRISGSENVYNEAGFRLYPNDYMDWVSGGTDFPKPGRYQYRIEVGDADTGEVHDSINVVIDVK